MKALEKLREYYENKAGEHKEKAEALGAAGFSMGARIQLQRDAERHGRMPRSAIAATRSELEGLRDEMQKDLQITLNVLKSPLLITRDEKIGLRDKAATLAYWAERLTEYLKGDPK